MVPDTTQVINCLVFFKIIISDVSLQYHLTYPGRGETAICLEDSIVVLLRYSEQQKRRIDFVAPGVKMLTNSMINLADPVGYKNTITQ